MKRTFVFLLLFLSFCQASWGQSSEDKRRVEEEKRKNLAPSESYQIKIDEVSPPSTGLDQQGFFSELLSKDAAVYSDAYRVIVILMGKEDKINGLEASYNLLKQEKILPPNIDVGENHDKPLRKGVGAYMFAKTMDLKGGLTLRIFGLNQRYALKELVYQEIMYPGNVYDIMSGQELILTLMKAADYLAEKQP